MSCFEIVKLGFVPAGQENKVMENGVVEVLADIYGRWATGGGVAAVDINSVVAQISNLTAKYGNLFQVCCECSVCEKLSIDNSHAMCFIQFHRKSCMRRLLYSIFKCVSTWKVHSSSLCLAQRSSYI